MSIISFYRTISDASKGHKFLMAIGSKRNKLTLSRELPVSELESILNSIS